MAKGKKRVPVRGWNSNVKIAPPEGVKDRYELFRFWLIQHAEIYGVVDDAEVMRALRFLEETLAERIMDEATGNQRLRKQKNAKRKRYIAIFKRKYLELVDLQYTKAISAGECKSIDRTIETLDGRHLSFEAYLDWFFEEVDENRDRLGAPAITMSFAKSFLDTFIMRNKERSSRRKREERESLERKELLARAREIMRLSPSEELSRLMEEHRVGAVSLPRFRDVIERMESERS